MCVKYVSGKMKIFYNWISRNGCKIFLAIISFFSCLVGSLFLVGFLIKVIISTDDLKTTTNIFVFAISIIFIPFCVGLTRLLFNVNSGKEILMDATKGICYALGVGIIVGIIPVMVGESIRDNEKQDYRPEAIINETISNYERKLIIEETEKGLIEKNYKSRFINNDTKAARDIREQIRKDVVNKINK